MAYQALNILIGNACDMKCKYCLQTGIDVPANRPADLTFFAEQLALNLKGDMPKRIIFWGGEPMIYWRNIRQVLDLFEVVGIFPKEGFFITTNGQKMTDEYVQYVNSHRVWTTVSTHDWDFSEDQMTRIFQLDHFSLSAIIHHHQLFFWDLRERFYALEEKFGFKPRLYLHFVRANDGCMPEFYLTKSDVDVLCDHLLYDVMGLALRGDDWARWQCSQLLSDRNREVAKGQGSKCVRDDSLSIDLHGNIYQCHHNFDASNICGNLFKKTIPIHPVGSISPHIYSDSQACRECEIFEECHGGCYLSNTHEVDCYLAKRLHEVYEIFSTHLPMHWN